MLASIIVAAPGRMSWLTVSPTAGGGWSGRVGSTSTTSMRRLDESAAFQLHQRPGGSWPMQYNLALCALIDDATAFLPGPY
ncbi:hypothetical protein DSL92_04180 [Billgrantia gudaonensis]|uniref:Uncharacterized protein n=1 Tax=Billgrantia gudaonensis TaxID=376427 RepID=A0A432JJF5_9GAMM|nr:hypothetical protein DSL92_04180 [Halomonas gudaonensis]